MADVIRKATNKFTKGLVLDFSPENTKNEVLTHALNATLLTFNGNELSLQNDMGNARVETAYLPEGYMPVGTCEYGGIIYIVSYNPLEDKSQIGCFPSPERNISNKELGRPNEYINKANFQKFENGEPTGDILNTTQYVLLKDDNLNPGDKFIVCSGKELYDERLADLWVDKDAKYYEKDDPKDFELTKHPIIALNVVSIEDSGKIVYLNSDLKQYVINNTYTQDGEEYTDIYKYHILGEMPKNENGYEQAAVDVDSYRNVLSSGYSVFKSKTSGKLAVLAELITIDSYSVTHSIIPRKFNGEDVEGSFDVIIHTDISPQVTESNYNIVPKLQYYYLQNSQGYLQATSGGKEIIKNLFNYSESDNTYIFNNDFLTTSLSDIYTPTTPENPLKLGSKLNVSGQFNFPKPDTYHGRMQEYNYPVNGTLASGVYTKFTEGKYHRLQKTQIWRNKEDFRAYYETNLQAKFYRYNSSGNSYVAVDKTQPLEEAYTYYIKITEYEYTDAKRNADKYNKEGVILYKYASEPHVATESELKNKEIEKFHEKTITTYLQATQEDIDNGEQLYIKSPEGNKYETIVGKPEAGKIYYIRIDEIAFVSIGKGVINSEDYTDQIYYYPSEKDYIEATEDDLEKYWDFNTYPMTNAAPWGCPEMLYDRSEKVGYRLATETEKLKYQEPDIELYYSPKYAYVDNMELFSDNTAQLFIVVPIDTYLSLDRFVPNDDINYIQGCEKPYSAFEPSEGFPNEEPISLYTVADFIPSNVDSDDAYLQYLDLKLANIKIPREVSVNGLDLPFKYDYTLVPCMNFGKLQHLAVSNTVDFSKLHAFNQSEFTTFKYHIDDNQLRLTFGADVYDTYETDKVDGLVLEFYDLWGFAGSIEITDKKSYSGIFTKIIPLNALNAISKNRIIGSVYSNTYSRNINIVEQPKNANAKADEEPVFMFNSEEVMWSGYGSGWRYAKTNKALAVEDNDCGTLYSNLVYGVKTYLRRTKNKGESNEVREFIPKKEFFLYTLPIFNDYYYTINDFNTLTNPQLEMMLTYKMQDSSSKIPYTSDDIENGYYKKDYELIKEYLSGFLRDTTDINTIKYYKYKGTTDLFLEIGLKKEYSDLNLSYSPNINKYFSCNLQLVSEDKKDKTYTVTSESVIDLNEEQILNYKYKSYTPISTDVNKLGFDNFSGTKSILKDNFNTHNFIYKEGSPVKINYEFVVGYKISIEDIRTTEIQATTVCALYHQDLSGNFNAEDFGVYEQVGEDGNIQYLSSAMFYNEGTAEKEVFGLCRQVKTKGNNMIEECQAFTSVETDAQPIKTAGKLNTGDPLKQLVNHIGKLTFCQPHAHGLSEANGVNIHESDDFSVYGIPPEVGNWDAGDSEDDTYGIAPRDFLFKHPKYNLSLNTKNSINYNSEFISTIDWKVSNSRVWGVNVDSSGEDDKEGRWKSGYDMREYTGFTGEQISLFNKKLLKTMSSVYAYNPDYDSLAVNIGNVVVHNDKVKFLSNLLSINSKIEFDENKTLNDFIYLGPICFSKYISYLNKYSEDSKGVKIQVYYEKEGNLLPLEQLKFEPGYTYCGTPESNYLISSLTYNTPAPKEIESELAFKSSNSMLVKHSDGSVEFLNGIPDKKTLYGFNKDLGKLIQLDVANYKIEEDGTLSFLSNTINDEKQDNSLTITEEIFTKACSSQYEFSENFVSSDSTNSTVDLSLELQLGSSQILQYGPNSVILAVRRDNYPQGVSFNVALDPTKNKEGYTYSTEIKEYLVSCSAKVLNSDLVSLYEVSGKINLTQLSYDELHNMLEYNENVWVSTDQTLTNNGEIVTYNSFLSSEPAYFVVDTNNSYEERYGDIELYEISIGYINYILTRSTTLKDISSSIVRTSITRKYISNFAEKYIIESRYNAARIRGTSLTINDLVYEPNTNGHRLFIKNNCYMYNNTYRGKLYYRSLDFKNDKKSWRYKDDPIKYLNNIFFFTGPCFTEENLNYNSAIDG